MEGACHPCLHGRSIGSFGRVSNEHFFTADIDGYDLASMVRFHALTVLIVNLPAALGHGVRVESHHKPP